MVTVQKCPLIRNGNLHRDNFEGKTVSDSLGSEGEVQIVREMNMQKNDIVSYSQYKFTLYLVLLHYLGFCVHYRLLQYDLSHNISCKWVLRKAFKFKVTYTCYCFRCSSAYSRIFPRVCFGKLKRITLLLLEKLLQNGITCKYLLYYHISQ